MPKNQTENDYARVLILLCFGFKKLDSRGGQNLCRPASPRPPPPLRKFSQN